MNISVEQAVGILEIMGSNQDPIFFKGEESTPDNLTATYGHEVCEITPASKVYIQYWGGDPHRKIMGTLQGMVRERMNGY